MNKNKFGQLEMSAQVTSGVCPTCTAESMFVSLSPDIFRCVTCGADCKQHINGKISYMPHVTKKDDIVIRQFDE
jgi:uncharacterized protein (DUF983 family)|tara:strand:+ start:361 stop:582 length:222 start_codon:yes stop_codon:yes gene_type:complete